MAAPQGQYPPQGYADEQYPQQGQPGFAPAVSPPPQAGQHESEVGKKKKRGYAAQAYDFGAGANSALGGQTHQGGAFQPAQAPAYGGGYPQQPAQQPVYGAPQYGAQDGGPAVGGMPAQQGYGAQPQYGYQPPDAGYPGPGAGASPSMGGITQGMGQMNVGGSPQMPSHPGAARAVPLNQLYPTDLVNQPLNVAELELPPPPIILPPNVSMREKESRSLLISKVERHSLTRCELPSQICPINSECCSYYAFASKEVKATIRACHSTICLIT